MQDSNSHRATEIHENFGEALMKDGIARIVHGKP